MIFMATWRGPTMGRTWCCTPLVRAPCPPLIQTRFLMFHFCEKIWRNTNSIDIAEIQVKYITSSILILFNINHLLTTINQRPSSKFLISHKLRLLIFPNNKRKWRGSTNFKIYAWFITVQEDLDSLTHTKRDIQRKIHTVLSRNP